MKRVRFAIGCAIAATWAVSAVGAATAPQVKTHDGALVGKREGDVNAFLGVPFAAPPVGQNRWRAPGPVKPWTGERAADHFAASCWQQTGPGGFGPWTHEYVVSGPVSEDCLYLNVWAPAKAGGKRPVLVWIHGGGFSQGSGSVPIYNGAKLAAEGIVVVDINYRLGVFGFLAHPELTREAGGAPPANFGLQDMVAALKWVKANISAFGGDPGQVTIAGQSAGSMAVHDLIASPMAAGLFQRAIAESGLPTTAPAPPLAEAEQAGQAFAKAKGADNLAALRALSPEKLAGGPPTAGARFFPVVDGVLLKEQPATAEAEGRGNDTPLLAGLNADEGSAMSPAYGKGDEATYTKLLQQSFGASAPKFAALYPASTDQARADASRELLRDRGLAGLYVFSRGRVAKSHAPLYLYLFTHTEPGPTSAQYRAFHSAEIPYVFKTLDASPERPFTAADRALSDQLSRYWVNFVRTGDPNSAGLPVWPRAAGDDPQVQALGDPIAPRPVLPPRLKTAFDDYIASGGKPDIF
jgi:para-nitrobenzyl esterase